MNHNIHGAVKLVERVKWRKSAVRKGEADTRAMYVSER